MKYLVSDAIPHFLYIPFLCFLSIFFILCLFFSRSFILSTSTLCFVYFVLILRLPSRFYDCNNKIFSFIFFTCVVFNVTISILNSFLKCWILFMILFSHVSVFPLTYLLFSWHVYYYHSGIQWNVNSYFP